MSALVFGGASQLVAMEVWTNPLTLAHDRVARRRDGDRQRALHPDGRDAAALARRAAGMAGLCGAATAPSTRPGSSHALSRRGRRDASVFVGAGLALWVVWVASAIPGYLLGAFIADPKRFGFDLMLPIFFAAMFVPLWRGARRAIGWAIAGVVALVVSYLRARLVVHRDRRARRQHRRRLSSMMNDAAGARRRSIGILAMAAATYADARRRLLADGPHPDDAARAALPRNRCPAPSWRRPSCRSSPRSGPVALHRRRSSRPAA